ncbi:MAG TPA: hypothetical protein VF911_16610 [Thermoanaerobaculia bacterium]
MFALALYAVFIAVACAFALIDWRRAWMLVPLCAVLQDPVRKLTPGAPVYISFAVVALWATMVFAARNAIAAHIDEFSRRFTRIYTAIVVFLLLLVLAAFNGVVTFGLAMWKVPLLSLFTYCIPLVAALLGYTWLQREEMLYRYLTVYAAFTSVAMIGSILEYARFASPVLGMVSFEGDFIRHLPGIQIRLLSGIYRSPDVMTWHAAMLSSIAIAMALRAGLSRKAVLWSAVATYGFFICMIAGRRKSVYMIVVFTVVFLWRYMPRLRVGQVLALLGVVGLLAGIVQYLAADESTNAYALGAVTSRGEIAQRLEGGVFETFRQYGYMGAGLGIATQGVYHLLGSEHLGTSAIGWQEGGLGKLAVEVGRPGLIAIAVIAWVTIRLLLRLTIIADVPGSSQFLRAMLFGLVAANGATFIASAQAYTDAVLALTSGFLVGCLFASAMLDERGAAAADAAPATPPELQPQLTSPAPA